MKTDIDVRGSKIYEYLHSFMDMSSEELMMIKLAVKEINEICPNEKFQLANKLDRLIKASDDLSWVTMVVEINLSKLKKEIIEVKAPEYTFLVRSNRPSHNAIENEIFMNHKDLMDKDNNYRVGQNVLEYLRSIEKNIDRYVWSIRDRLRSE